MTQPVLQLIALSLTLLSSWFTVRAILVTSPGEVAKISAGKFGFNLDAGKQFAEQKADNLVGATLLLFSFLVQMISMSQPVRLIDLDGLTLPQMFFCVFVICLTFLISLGVRNYLEKFFVERLKRELGL